MVPKNLPSAYYVNSAEWIGTQNKGDLKLATIFNQASLSFGGNVTNSNITEAELLSGLELTKTALSGSYGEGSRVVYLVTLSNMGSVPYTALTLNDDLGSYTLPGGNTAVPLDYVDGSIRYYLNGVLQPAPAVVGGESLQISGINIPAGANATFIYETEANEFALIAAGSTITNTASINGIVGIGELTDSVTVPVVEEVELSIAKAVCPAVLTDNGQLTYTIILQNSGNIPVIATDGVIVRDTFNPVLSDITVTLNGETLAEGVGYSYNEATGEFATTDGTVTIPAATYIQDPLTGAVTKTPGVSVLTVTGTV